MVRRKETISATIDPDVLREFDEKRGLAPRSAAIERLMNGYNRGIYKIEDAGGLD